MTVRITYRITRVTLNVIPRHYCRIQYSGQEWLDYTRARTRSGVLIFQLMKILFNPFHVSFAIITST